jgi:hypothetical protein
MPERAGPAATPEPDPPLRAGTWQPRPRARHARPAADFLPAESTADDPLRLSPEELPWGIPARAAGQEGHELPPPTVLTTRRVPRSLMVVATAVAVLVLLGLVLAVLF